LDCHNYQPCPVCRKCMAIDDGWAKCHKCYWYKQSRCKHTDADRCNVIRRKNFKLSISDDFGAWIQELSDKYQ
jgi:hypothetical protein